MQVNQQLIAEKLRISTATVSRSLSNHPAVHPQTRLKVLDLAARLGYRATSLDKGRGGPPDRPAGTESVAVLVQSDLRAIEEDRRHELMSTHVLPGISAALQRAGLILNLEYVGLAQSHASEEPETYLPCLRQDRLRGVILLQYFSPEFVARIAQRHPCVTAMNYYDDCVADTVTVDHAQAMWLALRHLLDAGHSSIGFIGGSMDRSWARQRLVGYIQGLHRAGLPYRPEWFLDQAECHNLDRELLAEQVMDAYRQGVRAFVCLNDHVAYETAAAVRTRGLSVPEDILLTGFDGSDPPPGQRPVPSVTLPAASLSEELVRCLCDRADRPDAPPRVITVPPGPLREVSGG